MALYNKVWTVDDILEQVTRVRIKIPVVMDVVSCEKRSHHPYEFYTDDANNGGTW